MNHFLCNNSLKVKFSQRCQVSIRQIGGVGSRHDDILETISRKIGDEIQVFSVSHNYRFYSLNLEAKLIIKFILQSFITFLTTPFKRIVDLLTANCDY